MIMKKEHWDALVEETQRLVRNIKTAQKFERAKIIKRAKQFNHSIKSINDLFKHMKRLQECNDCKKDYYDQICPECAYKNRRSSK